MNNNEKQLARIFFKLKIYESDGCAFQRLFENIMSKSNNNFTRIKPWGNIGDEKNDGFFQAEGIFYGVYGPEDFTKGIDTLCSKFESDFLGCVEKWKNEYKINGYHFVLNDKYKGIGPTAEKKRNELDKKFDKISVLFILPVDLEKIFLNLDELDVIDIVGFIPSPNEIKNLNYSVMSEVTSRIMENVQPVSYDENYDWTEFNRKIKFNNLKQADCLLKTAQYQQGNLDDFFTQNAPFLKDDLKLRFITLYEESKQIIPDHIEEKEDLRFFYILEKASSNTKDKRFQDAILILMAFFFEGCDIFETDN